jgi:hypothetical protein
MKFHVKQVVSSSGAGSIPAASTNLMSVISNLAHCQLGQLGLQLCAVVTGKATFGQHWS